MGWQYMIVCMFDFILFPIMWSILQVMTKVPDITQWQPLTLSGAGMYHIAMGAILGVAAWSRTQEKIATVKYPIRKDDTDCEDADEIARRRGRM